MSLGTGRPSLSRRSLIGGSGALAAALLSQRSGSLAQGLSGSIRIGFEGANTVIAPYVEATAKALMDANPGIELSVEPSVGANYINQVAMQLFTNQAPDVFLLLGIGSGELAQGGFIRPLDDYLEKWDGWAQYGEEARFGVSLQDHVWSVPWGLNVYFLFYRKELFEAAGLDPAWQPTTREEIIEAASAIKASSDSVIPYSIYAGANGENATAADFMTLISSDGGTLTDEQGRWFIESCPIQHTLEYYETAFQTAQVVPQSVLTDVSPLETLPKAFGNGELAILHETAKHYAAWISDDPANADSIGIARFPGPVEPIALGDAGDAWFINSRSGNPDLAWAFIEAFNSAEVQAALAVDDPHLPARMDARADPAFTAQPVSTAMLDAAASLVLPPPEPQFRKLIQVVQNATGLVAAGEASPEDAIHRYGDELTRTMGKPNVVAEPCV